MNETLPGESKGPTRGDTTGPAAYTRGRTAQGWEVVSGLACSGHEMVEFQISGGVSRTTSLNITALGAGGQTGLFRDWLGGIPRDTGLGRTGVQATQLIIMDHVLQAQERSISTPWKPSSGDRGLPR